MSKEAMKLALEALHGSIAITMAKIDLRNKAIKALEEALAKQEQGEPDMGGVDVFFPIGITRPTIEEVTRKPEHVAIREAFTEANDKRLEQEQGEPVAVIVEESTFDGYLRKGIAWNFRLDSFDIGTKFYTTPQQRTWVGLTQDQINNLCGMSDISAAVISAELLLKEKNT